ncbi:biotin/lipoyl-containing protein [Thermococcus sp. MV5]|uniref:biotin/lipoyl-containing protein n=1 Tax=Thermococcus sp. MV5 TaxID=1638272 RepID=UPI001F0CECA4|nr:biotin/lipoyl-containing protein [Thermococcus sp. MV5]
MVISMSSVNVIMPKLGMTMKKGTIIEWKKKVGEKVEKEEIIAIVESEKLTGEVKAPASGVLAKILHDIGDEVSVGEVIAIIETEGS